MVEHASMFSQLIAMIDRKKFHEPVYRHELERYANHSIHISILWPCFFVR